MAAPEARRRLLASLFDMLRVRSEDRPLFVLIDDLQWADELTIAFFDEATALREQLPRVLLVGTVRIEEGEEVLDALTSREVHKDVVAAVFERSGGNPFYAQETAQVAVTDGVLRRRAEGNWD